MAQSLVSGPSPLPPVPGGCVWGMQVVEDGPSTYLDRVGKAKIQLSLRKVKKKFKCPQTCEQYPLVNGGTGHTIVPGTAQL